MEFVIGIAGCLLTMLAYRSGGAVERKRVDEHWPVVKPTRSKEEILASMMDTTGEFDRDILLGVGAPDRSDMAWKQGG